MCFTLKKRCIGGLSVQFIPNEIYFTILENFQHYITVLGYAA
jgi:hypothetical protein